MCRDSAGDEAGLMWEQGWMGVRCLAAVGRADPPRSRQRKPFALELPDAESKAAPGSGAQVCIGCVGACGMEVGSPWGPVKAPCLAQEPLRAGEAWPCHAGAVGTCPGSSSSRSSWGSPVLLQLLDAVLQLSTAPVANKCFEASYFVCQSFPATDNCNAGAL